jgi:serine phosphatase RsbU (regulator of sigma subunit)
MSVLHIIPAQGDPFKHPLEGDSIVIGRSSECDLVLEDRFLSRRHTRLFKSGSDWLVEDMGSRNGTILNGTLVDEPTKVKFGDRLQLSGSSVSIQRTSEPSRITESQVTDLGQHTILRSASELMSDSESTKTDEIDDAEALRRVANRLKLLNTVHHALGQSVDLDELLNRILTGAFEHLKPEEGVIFLKDSNGEFYLAASHNAPGTKSEYLYSRTLIHEVAEQAKAALVIDMETDEKFGGAQSIMASGIRCLVAAPFLDHEGSVGMIALSSRAFVRQFTEEDMALLVSIASVAALRIRNVALAKEAAERQRLEEEVQLARRIQISLLPDQEPEIEGWELHGGNIPSRGCSGDYYLITERMEGEECVFMVADVSGKGIAAALLTASLEALAAGPIEVGHSTEEICTSTSRRLHLRTPPAKYATAFLAVLEPATGKLTYTNAGHNHGLIIRASGKVEELTPNGMPIGLMPNASYTSTETSLEPGDLLALYTDGITEAANPEEEEYDIERLADLCKKMRAAPLEEISASLEDDLEQFAQGVPFADDRTFVVARRLPS